MSTRPHAAIKAFATWACAFIISSCARDVAGSQVTRTLPSPPARADRDRALEQLGLRMFEALRQGSTHALLLPDDALGRVLEPEAAARLRVLRVSRPTVLEPAPRSLDGARYVGLCVQGLYLEPAGSPLGLTQPAMLVRRALVLGALPDQGAIAAWVEGTFVLTDQGFFALSIAHAEQPRRGHADLEIGVCDLAVGGAAPPAVVVERDEDH